MSIKDLFYGFIDTYENNKANGLGWHGLVHVAQEDIPKDMSWFQFIGKFYYALYLLDIPVATTEVNMDYENKVIIFHMRYTGIKDLIDKLYMVDALIKFSLRQKEKKEK